MAECDFSWFKIGSFFGALALAIMCFILLSFGITTIVGGSAFYGVACIVAGIVFGGAAVWVYKNYQKLGNH